MYKYKKIQLVDIEQFHMELGDLGEEYYLTNKIDENLVTLHFTDLKSSIIHITDKESEETLTEEVFYKKSFVVDEESLEEVEKWILYDATELLDKIEQIFSNHDITVGAKKEKISALSEVCGEIIESGILFGGKQYSTKVEDQVSISALTTLANAGMSVSWHANGESCDVFSPEDFIAFSNAVMMNVVYHQTYMGGVKDYINSLEDVDIINAFNYGDALPEDIQADVDAKLALYVQ